MAIFLSGKSKDFQLYVFKRLTPTLKNSVGYTHLAAKVISLYERSPKGSDGNVAR